MRVYNFMATMKSSERRNDYLVILPLGLITLFCFVFVISTNSHHAAPTARLTQNTHVLPSRSVLSIPAPLPKMQTIMTSPSSVSTSSTTASSAPSSSPGSSPQDILKTATPQHAIPAPVKTGDVNQSPQNSQNVLQNTLNSGYTVVHNLVKEL